VPFPLSVRLLPRITLLYSLCVTAPAPARAQAVAELLPHRLDATASFDLPFKLVGGLIILQQLTLNGQQGDFILDTGSQQGLVVDSPAFAGQLRAGPHTTGHGATGTVALQYVPVTTFQLGAARYSGFLATSFSLAHLQRYLGPQVHLLGFLGYGLLRDYEVVIDYPRLRMTFYSLHTPTQSRRAFVRQDSLAFTLVQGRPVATGAIGPAPVQLLLDTGAVTNDLDATFCRQLPPAAQPVLTGTDRTTGADSHAQPVQIGHLPSLVLGTELWQQTPVSVFPYAQPLSGRPLAYEGTLGHPYLLQLQVFSFHYGRQQLYMLTPLAATKAPSKP
jgi:hypothetical protein